MNAPERISLPDIQSQPDARNMPINAVGIKGMCYPVVIASAGRHTPTIASKRFRSRLASRSRSSLNR